MPFIAACSWLAVRMVGLAGAICWCDFRGQACAKTVRAAAIRVTSAGWQGKNPRRVAACQWIQKALETMGNSIRAAPPRPSTQSVGVRGSQLWHVTCTVTCRGVAVAREHAQGVALRFVLRPVQTCSSFRPAAKAAAERAAGFDGLVMSPTEEQSRRMPQRLGWALRLAHPGRGILSGESPGSDSRGHTPAPATSAPTSSGTRRSERSHGERFSVRSDHVSRRPGFDWPHPRRQSKRVGRGHTRSGAR